MELKVFESPGQEWDEFASRYTDLIFYQSVWSLVLKEGLGGQPLYFCLKEGGEIVAGLPGVLLDFRIFRILYASIPYGHVFGERAYFGSFVEILEREFRKGKIDQVRMTQSPFFAPHPLNSFKPLFAKCTLLDLKRFDRNQIWEGYREEVRRAIRKAKKKDLYVKRATSREEVKVFYDLYLSSMARNRAVAKYPLRWFDALYEILHPRGIVDILFAVKNEDQYAAGVVLVHSATSYHYLHNGSEASHLEARPNDLIVDYIIEKGVKEGKTILDFMGSSRDDLSLIRYKEKWGGQSIDVCTDVKDYHPFRCKIWEWTKRMGASSLGARVVGWVQGR